MDRRVNLDDLFDVETHAVQAGTFFGNVTAPDIDALLANPDPIPAATLVPVLEHDRCALLHGDGVYIEQVLAPNSIDSMVTDPPAGIDFMGKGWDSDKGGRDNWIAWLHAVVEPAFNVLKPGAHGLVWALPRTSHWTATALENAGFEIRDIVMHLFGTGFPKSLTSASAAIPDGTGSALKPAAEHWILVRKPLEGTYGENFAKYGTGVLNIDATRIGVSGGGTTCPDYPEPCKGHANQTSQTGITYHNVTDEVKGRWPSHVVLSHSEHCTVYDDGPPRPGECASDCPVLMLDAQSGNRPGMPKTKKRKGRTPGIVMGLEGADDASMSPGYGDSGGASRFFYVAKGARKEKDEGLDHLPVKSGGEATGRTDGAKGLGNPRAGAGRTGGARNFHPTVKGVDLMRYLVKLVTPPGGTVLDIFAGSGTTGVAALAEGRSFIGVELTAEYLPIITGRLQHALTKLGTN